MQKTTGAVIRTTEFGDYDVEALILAQRARLAATRPVMGVYASLHRTPGIKIESAPSARQIDHFWSMVEKGPGCWLWKGCAKSNNYAHFNYEPAHRFAYRITVGPIDADGVIHHVCGRPPCVNPDHLLELPYYRHTALHMRFRAILWGHCFSRKLAGARHSEADA